MAFLDENGLAELWKLIKGEDVKNGAGVKKIGTAKLASPANSFYLELENTLSNYSIIYVLGRGIKQTNAKYSSLHARVFPVASLSSTDSSGSSLCTFNVPMTNPPGGAFGLSCIGTSGNTVDGVCVTGGSSVGVNNVSFVDTKFLYVWMAGSEDAFSTGMTIDVWGVEA